MLRYSLAAGPPTDFPLSQLGMALTDWESSCSVVAYPRSALSCGLHWQVSRASQEALCRACRTASSNSLPGLTVRHRHASVRPSHPPPLSSTLHTPRAGSGDRYFSVAGRNMLRHPGPDPGTDGTLSLPGSGGFRLSIAVTCGNLASSPVMNPGARSFPAGRISILFTDGKNCCVQAGHLATRISY